MWILLAFHTKNMPSWILRDIKLVSVITQCMWLELFCYGCHARNYTARRVLFGPSQQTFWQMPGKEAEDGSVKLWPFNGFTLSGAKFEGSTLLYMLTASINVSITAYGKMMVVQVLDIYMYRWVVLRVEEMPIYSISWLCHIICIMADFWDHVLTKIHVGL